MSCTRDLAPWKVDLTITTATTSYLWDSTWYPSTGVGAIDFTVDSRNLDFTVGQTLSLKPAIQLAAVRNDRPDPGAAISAGSGITSSTLTHYEETLSAATKFWFRRGWSFSITGGYARAELTMFTSFRSCGTVFSGREVVFNPTNDTAVPSYFPITGPFAAIGVDKAKLALVAVDNLNNKMEYRLAGRAFNDPSFRGSWVDLEAGWNASTSGDFINNSGEVDPSSLGLTTNHWMELALAVRKDATPSANSRCIFHVIPAIKYV